MLRSGKIGEGTRALATWRSLPRALTEWSSYKESACGESKRASAPTPSQNPVVVLLPATSASSDGAARDQR